MNILNTILFMFNLLVVKKNTLLFFYIDFEHPYNV